MAKDRTYRRTTRNLVAALTLTLGIFIAGSAQAGERGHGHYRDQHQMRGAQCADDWRPRHHHRWHHRRHHGWHGPQRTTIIVQPPVYGHPHVIHAPQHGRIIERHVIPATR